MSFKAIKGQDSPLEILQAYLENSRLEGGYLFIGPEGVGKKMAALALAQVCLKTSNNQHPDLHLIAEESSQIKIDAIRHLQKEISLKSYEAGFKIFIIDNAHNLTSEAGNCLLKILEEPPKKSLIILISDKPNLLFKTIISRCKVIKFSALKRDALEDILRKDYLLESRFAHFLAYFSEGRLGRALKLKDTDIFAAKNSLIDKFVLAAKPNIDSLAAQDRQEITLALNLLAAWFRDIYLLKAGMPEDTVINADRFRELALSANSFSFEELDTIMANITAALSCLGQNVNTRLLLYNLGMDLWKA